MQLKAVAGVIFAAVLGAGLFQACKTPGKHSAQLSASSNEQFPMLMDFTEPGPNLPPRGRSLFDIMTADGTTQTVPYPLSELMELVSKNAPGYTIPQEGSDPRVIDPYFTLLLPKGRSIQKNKVDAAHPRVIVAATGGVRKESGKLGVNYAERLFVGYAEKAESLEVISYNPDAGRFEFQIVKDYAEGKTPKVFYANRALCMTCHHNHGPLFSHSPWSETNSFEKTRDVIQAAMAGQTEYMGAPIAPVDNGGRQGPAGEMEGAARSGGSLLDAIAFYQRFRPVCAAGQADCAAYKKKNAPEVLRKELHVAAVEAACFDINMFGSTRLEKLAPLQTAFVAADFPGGVHRPDDLVDDLVPRFGNVSDHLADAIIDPTKPKRFPPQIRLFSPDNGDLSEVVRFMADDYKPNCEHIKTVPTAKLLLAFDQVAAGSVSGDNDVFTQIGFNSNNVIAAVIKQAGLSMNLTNVERDADDLPKNVMVDIETDVALPNLSEPSALMFTKHCGACHGANGDIPLFVGGESEIKQAVKKPDLAKEIYRRLNWEADADSGMPPKGSKQREDLNKTNHRPQMMRLVEAAAFGLPENPTGSVGGSSGFNPQPGGSTPPPQEPDPQPSEPTPQPGLPNQPFKLGVNAGLVNYNNEPWVRFQTVTEGGRAYQAGMRSGDMIKRVSDVQVYSMEQFDQLVAAAVPTGKVRIKYRRIQGGTFTDGEAVIPSAGASVSGPGAGGGSGQTAGPFKLGVSLDIIFWNNENWVRLKAVTPGGRAATANMKAGDMILRINDNKIFSEADFDTYLAQAASSGNVRIKIRRYTGNSSNDYEVNIAAP